jgi:DNA-binding MarR family transcriptional regulator
VFALEPMRALQRAAHAKVMARLAAAGYPDVRIPHINLLAYIPRGERTRMGVLAQRLELTNGAVTQLVDHLERLGLVERSRDPDDRRIVLVTPTEAAEVGYEAARACLAEIEDGWAARVGPHRWAVFTGVLRELAQEPA